MNYIKQLQEDLKREKEDNINMINKINELRRHLNSNKFYIDPTTSIDPTNLISTGGAASAANLFQPIPTRQFQDSRVYLPLRCHPPRYGRAPISIRSRDGQSPRPVRTKDLYS